MALSRNIPITQGSASASFAFNSTTSPLSTTVAGLPTSTARPATRQVVFTAGPDGALLRDVRAVLLGAATRNIRWYIQWAGVGQDVPQGDFALATANTGYTAATAAGVSLFLNITDNTQVGPRRPVDSNGNEGLWLPPGTVVLAEYTGTALGANEQLLLEVLAETFTGGTY